MTKVHTLKLGRSRFSFYDPVTGLNLSPGNPQGTIPAGVPVSKAISTALVSGGLVDVGNTIKPFRENKIRAEIEPHKEAVVVTTTPEPVIEIEPEPIIEIKPEPKPKKKKAPRKPKPE